MNSIIAIALIVTSGNPCVSNLCVPAYSSHHIAVQQIHVPYFYAPVGYHVQQHKTQDELTAAALERLNLTIREAQGLQSPLALSGGIDLSKCTRCHGPASTNDTARDAFTMDAEPILDAALSAKVLKGLRAGMAGPQYAKLDDKSQQRWFDVLVETMNTHFEGDK